jgi:photosystem II stability/assembly factor-like uncharacterized protein
MFDRPLTLLLALATLAAAQTPTRLAYECTAADTQAAGIGCSEEDPCPVYLELDNVESAGAKPFITGNLHTAMATLNSILLSSDDAGKTWTEPHPRIRQSGLDQIQFLDSQTGWISGANLQGAPRDPFFLITSDGGKTWSERPVFDETRVAAIERFRFNSPSEGELLIDARLDSGKRESYQTHDGGQTWAAPKYAADGVNKPKPLEWRLRTDAATHSYVVEKSENNRWQKVASFLVNIASCKE